MLRAHERTREKPSYTSYQGDGSAHWDNKCVEFIRPVDLCLHRFTGKVTELALVKAIPQIIKLARDPGESVHRSRILTLLRLIVTEIQKKFDSIISLGLQSLLLSFKDEVLGAFIAGIKKADSSEAALEGLKILTQMDGVLTDGEVAFLVAQVNDVLQADPENPEVAKYVVALCLKACC